MKIDYAIQNFMEKYDRCAIESIERVSGELGLRANRYTIPGFNITEAFDRFCEYLQGYGDYKLKNIENENASPQSVIRESVSNFITNDVFKECEIPYSELGSFVTGYLEGVKKLSSVVDEVKSNMMMAGVEMESVGDVNDFTDHFMDILQEAFDPVMDKMLWASGYNARQRLMTPKKEEVLPTAPVFL